MRASIFFILISVFIFSSSTVEAQRKSDPARKFITQLNDTVPEFTFTTLDGKTHKMSDFRGKVVWLNFFATWCGPCVKEIPHLTHLAEEMKKEDVVILFFGRKHNVEELTPFYKRMKISPSQIIADPDREFYFHFAEKYVPRNCIIDKKGIIVKQSVGFDEGLYQRMVVKFKELAKEN